MIKNKFIRGVLLVIGFISLGLGFVGMVFPILPTVPFLLLTSLCFVKSSKKFNDWFIKTKIYNKYLANFQKNKVMTLHAELILIVSVSILLMVSLYLINNLAMTIVFSLLIAFKCLYFSFNIRPVSKKEFVSLNQKLLKEGN